MENVPSKFLQTLALARISNHLKIYGVNHNNPGIFGGASKFKFLLTPSPFLPYILNKHPSTPSKKPPPPPFFHRKLRSGLLQETPKLLILLWQSLPPSPLIIGAVNAGITSVQYLTFKIDTPGPRMEILNSCLSPSKRMPGYAGHYLGINRPFSFEVLRPPWTDTKETG